LWNLRSIRRFLARSRSPDGSALRRGPPPNGSGPERDVLRVDGAAQRVQFLHYGLAVATTVLASSLTLHMPAVRERQTLIFLLAAVVASTWYGGRWPGLLATLLAGVASVGLRGMHAGLGGLVLADWVELGAFGLVALGMNALAAEPGRAAGNLRRSRDDLEHRVEVSTSELLQANEALQAGAELRQRAEQALSQFAAVEASREDAVFALRLDGTIVSCNPAAEKFYGRATMELIGRSMAVLLPRGAAAKLPHMLQRVARGETIPPFETARQRGPAPALHLLVSISPIKSAGGRVQGICALVHDISRRKLAEKTIKLYQQQLRGLASALSFAEQRERRRIATELHDHLAQLLVLSRMKIRMLQSTLTDEEVAKPIEGIRLLLDESIDYTRTLIWDLCPPMLHEVGLEAALEWLAEQTQERHGIRVRFEDDEQPKVSDEKVRVLLFHAVHELLMNVIKHANATRAVVAVRRREEQVEIRVEDDGVGFDTEGVRLRVGQDGGFGLFSIRERLDVIGGTFEMSSSPGVGSRATLRAPLWPGGEVAMRKEA
jgi:PAS domain S-box-containing protein